MVIRLKANLANPGLPLKCQAHYTGSALPVRVAEVPSYRAGRAVTGVRVTVTNADGLDTVVDCERHESGWTCIFPATLFASYGVVTNGVKVELVMGEHFETVAIGDIEIRRTSAEAPAGEAAKYLAHKGDDIFVKTAVVDGVQHFALQVVRYDAEMGAWGAEWTGDYILNSDGQFVEV